jgi:hypothetical protein
MATLIAHLAVGERVCATMQYLRSSSQVYGAFLLGCVLVDANYYSGLGRHQTHFTKLSDGEGGSAPRGSCGSFLKQLDSVLLHRWDALSEPEQVFVAGYLCHLAADEAWLEVSWGLLQELGLRAWEDLPVPAEVMLLAFNELSQDLFEDFSIIASALYSAAIPEVFAHVSQESFRKMWDTARAYVLDGGNLESYLALLESRGKTYGEIQTVRQHGEGYREEAIALIKTAGGIERFIRAAVERSVKVIPQLWVEGSSGG